MRIAGSGGRALAGLALLASIGVAGCTANSTTSSLASGPAQTASPTAAAPSSSGVTPSTTTAPTATSTPTGSADSAAVRNLSVTGATRSALTAAYAAFKGIPQSDIAGTRPDSVYYAFDPAADTYWAMAVFVATTTAPMNVTVNFQDGGDIGLFSKVGAGSWQVRLGGEPAQCTELTFYPHVVLAAWSMPTSPTTANMC